MLLLFPLAGPGRGTASTDDVKRTQSVALLPTQREPHGPGLPRAHAPRSRARMRPVRSLLQEVAPELATESLSLRPTFSLAL